MKAREDYCAELACIDAEFAAETISAAEALTRRLHAIFFLYAAEMEQAA